MKNKVAIIICADMSISESIDHVVNDNRLQVVLNKQESIYLINEIPLCDTVIKTKEIKEHHFNPHQKGGKKNKKNWRYNK